MSDGTEGVTEAMTQRAWEAQPFDAYSFGTVRQTLKWAFRDPAFRAAIVRDVVENADLADMDEQLSEISPPGQAVTIGDWLPRAKRIVLAAFTPDTGGET